MKRVGVGGVELMNFVGSMRPLRKRGRDRGKGRRSQSISEDVRAPNICFGGEMLKLHVRSGIFKVRDGIGRIETLLHDTLIKPSTRHVSSQVMESSQGRFAVVVAALR